MMEHAELLSQKLHWHDTVGKFGLISPFIAASGCSMRSSSGTVPQQATTNRLKKKPAHMKKGYAREVRLDIS